MILNCPICDREIDFKVNSRCYNNNEYVDIICGDHFTRLVISTYSHPPKYPDIYFGLDAFNVKVNHKNIWYYITIQNYKMDFISVCIIDETGKEYNFETYTNEYNMLECPDIYTIINRIINMEYFS